jgi:hypothetical protein
MVIPFLLWLLSSTFGTLGWAAESSAEVIVPPPSVEARSETAVITSSEPAGIRKSILLGHNLTPTTETLYRGTVTAGWYALAVGVTDNLTIGTSPWLASLYNMPNLDARITFDGANFIDLWTVEGAFFKTYAYGNNDYRQESTLLRLTGSHRFNSTYTLYVSGAHQYYFDDTAPFSLRLDPGSVDTRSHLSVSTLHKLRLTENFGFFLEAGLAGLNYAARYSHLGASVFAQWNWGMAQVGFSRTSSLGSLRDGEPAFEQRGDRYVFRSDSYSVTHPEMQLQAFF